MLWICSFKKLHVVYKKFFELTQVTFEKKNAIQNKIIYLEKFLQKWKLFMLENFSNNGSKYFAMQLQYILAYS